MRFNENYWHIKKYLENRCEVYEKISGSFRDSVEVLQVSEKKTKTSSEN